MSTRSQPLHARAIPGLIPYIAETRAWIGNSRNIACHLQCDRVKIRRVPTIKLEKGGGLLTNTMLKKQPNQAFS